MQSSTLYTFSISASGRALLATRIHVLLFVLALPDVSHAAKGPQLSNPPANACTVALFPFPPLLEASQRSLHNAPIFRLLLKVAVNGTHQCDFLNFCGGSGSQQQTSRTAKVEVSSTTYSLWCLVDLKFAEDTRRQLRLCIHLGLQQSHILL